MTFNPLTATKQRYAFDAKLQKLQAALYEIRGKAREDARGCRQEAKVRERYELVCEDLHLPKHLYDLTFECKDKQVIMGFRKNYYRSCRDLVRLFPGMP